jgi:hypothetical protein
MVGCELFAKEKRGCGAASRDEFNRHSRSFSSHLIFTECLRRKLSSSLLYEQLLFHLSFVLFATCRRVLISLLTALRVKSEF